MFRTPERSATGETAERLAAGKRLIAGNGVATVVTAIAVAAPFLQPLGWCDVWPAWAVYSARPAIVAVYVDGSRVPDLPASLQNHVGPAEPLTEWRPVNLDGWSFAERGCPLYPQKRYRLALARAAAEAAGLEGDVRIEVRDPPDRRSGAREEFVVDGTVALIRECERFRINTAARRSE